MKAKNLKPMIISALLAVGFGATTVGTSFALFTDSAETNINVTAGKVDVNTEILNAVTYSAVASSSGTVLDENSAKYVLEDNEELKFDNGGAASIANQTITLDRMTPGDGIKFDYKINNSSNVATKYRFNVATDEDQLLLFSGLDISFKNETLNIDKSYHGLKRYQTKWLDAAALANLGTFSFDIMMPLNATNELQNLTGSILISIEAVQGNANVVDEEYDALITGIISNTAETENIKVDGSWVLINDVEMNTNITVPAETDCVLDLNGHSLDTNGKRIYAAAGSTITITDSSLDGEGVLDHTDGDLFLYALSESEINVENTTIDAGQVAIGTSGSNIEVNVVNSKLVGRGNVAFFNMGAVGTKVNITNSELVAGGGAFYSGGGNNTNVYTIVNSSLKSNGVPMQIMDSPVLNVSDTVIKNTNEDGSFGITTNGGDSLDAVINLANVEVEAAHYGMYIASCSEINITGGTYYGKEGSGAEIRGGDIRISGNPYFKTDAATLSVHANDGGTTTIGSGLAIVQHVTKAGISASISGGTFEGEAGVVFVNPQSNVESNVVYSITGGTFIGRRAGIMNLDTRVTMAETSAVINEKQPNTVNLVYIDGGSHTLTTEITATKVQDKYDYTF